MKDKTKRALTSTAYLAVVIAAILFVNIIIGTAAEKFRMKWDLTENKLFTLSEETTALLDSLEKEVTLYYFASPGRETAEIKQTLDMYRTATSKLKFVQSDPNTDPIAARRFTDKGIDIAQNSMVLECGDRFKAVAAADMYNSYTTQSGETMDNAFFALEQLITRAIGYVVSNVDRTVYFTIGHNEADYAYLMQALENENVITAQIDLKTTEIPADADALYVMSPADDFTADELLRLDAYLATGKSMQVCFNSTKKPLPLFEQYLTQFWGVTMYPDLVCESDDTRTVNYPYIFMPDCAEHAITQSITTGNKRVVWNSSRSMELVEAENVTATPLITAAETAYSVHGTDRTIKDILRKGNMPLAAVLTRTAHDGTEARLVVSGSYLVYNDMFLQEAGIANSDLFYGTLRYLDRDDDNALSVSPKSMFMRTVMLSDGLTKAYIFLICVLPALLVFVCGAVKWRRRRHL